MAFEQRDNSGALFKNERKAAPTHADYTGTIMVAGVTYWLNAWVKDGQKGKFFSIAVKPKEEVRQEAQRKPAPTGAGRDPLDDEIPFAPEFR
jgi:hypothetical protein